MTTPATDPNPEANAPDPTTTPTTPSSPQGGRTFTQEEVNRMTGKVRQEAAEQYGKYGDIDQLRQDSEAYQKLLKANMTAEDRVKHELATSQKENATLTTRMITTALTADIKTRAALQGVDPDIAVAMVDRAGIQYDMDTGQVTGTEEALQELLITKPLLANLAGKATGTHPPNLNPGPGTPTPPPGTALTQDEKDVAARMGLTEERYAASKAKAPVWRPL